MAQFHLLNYTGRRWGMLLSQQLGLEASNFPLEVPQHGVLGVLIDARLVGDILGSVGIPKGAQGLLIVVPSWPNVGHHDCLGVPTQRVLRLLLLESIQFYTFVLETQQGGQQTSTETQ